MKDLVGPYRILRPLGHGGMGIVYLGVHDHLGREVAIKALAPELTRHPQFRERFFAEARVQAKLQHTNIVTIYDLIEDGGSYFIVMELVPGPTLESLLKESDGRGWDAGPALALFRQILAGLDYAHSKGVIHRDVKPSNVLVAEGEQAKLTDFGIALLIGDKRLTASQSTIGTPIYMSPEQILRPLWVDHRSDVYSAAIVLYEMLAGRPPFDAGTEYEIKKLQIEAPVPDLQAINPRVPAAVVEAIATALRKDPDDRFQSAGAFLRALRNDPIIASVHAVEAPVIAPANRAEPLPDRPLARLPKPAVVAAAVLLAVVGLAFLAFTLRESPADPPPAVNGATPAVVSEPAVAPEPASAPVETVPLAPTPLASPPPIPEARALRIDPPDPAGVELAALKSGLQRRLQGARGKVASKDFEGARREIEVIESIVEGRPAGLEDEKESLRRLERALVSAVQAQETQEAQEAQERAEEARVPESQKNQVQITETPAAPRRERIEPAHAPLPPDRRTLRKLTVFKVKIQPETVAPGVRALVVARAFVEPPFQQPTTVNLKARVMKNLDEVATLIERPVTLQAGERTWTISIPIRFPSQVPACDCYLEVEMWDSAQEIRGAGRIGFRIQ